MRSRCHPHYAVYNIKKFFRSVHTSDQDSFLRIVCVPSNSFSCLPTPNPTWSFFRDRATPFESSPTAILQAVLEDTYLDDGGVGANSASEISMLQDKIGKILRKGGFYIKSWEFSGEDGVSKYLGMTWDHLKDHYLLKFHLNLQKKSCGIPSGADLDSEFLQDPSTRSPRRMFSPWPASSTIPLDWLLH